MWLDGNQHEGAPQAPGGHPPVARAQESTGGASPPRQQLAHERHLPAHPSRRHQAGHVQGRVCGACRQIAL